MNSYQTIEIGQGQTYQTTDWVVYKHGQYPSHSVLAGRPSRAFLGSFKTLSEAQAEYPNAEVIRQGTTFREMSVDHLPDTPDY